MPRIRSFRRRVFVAVLAVALVPTVAALVAGTVILREVGSSTGTLGPWDAVASSGRNLIDAATEASPDDAAVEETARLHGEALAASVRQSRLYTLVTERVISLLPFAAIVLALGLTGLAAWVAAILSRSFSRPINELVGWTRLIGRGEPLPAADSGPVRGTAELDALRTALRTMAGELEHARARDVESARLRAWTEMARRVAHELKNPLTPMRMSAVALARHEDASVRGTADMLLEEVARLDDMARSFAQFGRLPEGPPAPVDLRELLQALVARHDGQPAPVHLHAAASVPMVQGHHELLSRAVRNLIINAQEAVMAVTSPRIEVRLEPGPDGARIRVSDNGPGIAPEILSEVWLPDVTTKHSGTGLGLALVKQAVDAHGGRVAAENRPEGGAVFDLVLPSAGRAAERARGRDDPSPA